MKKQRLSFRSEKKSKRVLPTVLAIIGLLLSSLVVWIGLNDWDVDKTLRTVGVTLSISEEEVVPIQEEREIEPDNTEIVVPDTPEIPEEQEEPKISRTEYIEGQELPKEPTYVDGILLANKQHPLPATFTPGESKEARAEFEKLADEARKSGYELTAFSTYRSYDYQVNLYRGYKERDGAEEADRYSARPGYSEHQTGLAFDIGEVGKEQDWASSRFGETEAGKWLANNAHEFGFIMRYPEGKEDITGYMYESWHFRYVGKEIAEEIFRENLTLEQYLGI